MLSLTKFERWRMLSRRPFITPYSWPDFFTLPTILRVRNIDNVTYISKRKYNLLNGRS